jgi:recombination protein RecT
MSTQALKAVATGQVAADKAPTIFDYLEHAKVRKGITAVVGKYLRAERMLTLCVNAVKKTPRLLQCDPQSVLGAMMSSAALGLEPSVALPSPSHRLP